MESIARFCDWLSETTVSQTLQAVGWIVPTVQSLHILAIGIVMASALLLDLRLLGLVSRRQPIPKVFAALNPFVWVGLLVLSLSGLLLIITEPRRALLNSVFQAKMALLVIAVLVTAGLQQWAAAGASSNTADTPRGGVRAATILSLVLWVAIIGCGRWIAYVEHG